MGWSLPEVPEKEPAPVWSPWVCLLIIILGLFIGLLVAVLKSPTTGLPSLSSGYWLPLTAGTFEGILRPLPSTPSGGKRWQFVSGSGMSGAGTPA